MFSNTGYFFKYCFQVLDNISDGLNLTIFSFLSH